jgi:predicted RNA binding protein YcfA (HicA-like mRNA interferase family)
MSKKLRELIHELNNAGFYEILGGGKGLHRKFTHYKYTGAVMLSGKLGDDAKSYHEKQVKRVIEMVKK